MRGYTVIELVLMLAVVAGLTHLATSNLPEWVARHRADSSLQGLRSTINFARHAAIVRQQTVVVCPDAAPNRRQASGCGSRDTWHLGTLVFADRTRNHRLDPDDDVLRRLPGIPDGHIYWRAFRSRSYLVFTPSGITDWQNGHLLYCPTNQDPRLARQLILNFAGRTYPSRDANGDGVHENHRGKPLFCPS